MNLIEVKDQKTWDAFVERQPWASFPQSWAWGEFQRSLGKDVKRFFLVGAHGDAPIIAAQLIHEKRRFSGYWFAPRGPVFAGQTDQKKAFEALLAELTRVLPGAMFWRFEPMLEDRAALPSRLVRTHAMNPASTIVMDLRQNEDALLKGMHEKTRYNIRLSQRHGVKVREGNVADLATFLQLTEETAKRDGFLSHSTRYLQSTYEALAPAGLARLRVAEHEGKSLAINMEIVFGDTVTYLHGASSSQSRNVMAPFALQWEAMCAAKAEGKKFYDLWGANPETKEDLAYKPSWEGITRFKRGFGGEQKDLVGTHDLPLRPWLYRLAVR